VIEKDDDFESALASYRAAATHARSLGLCIICQQAAAPRIRSAAGQREYQISACCEECFDRMYGDEDESDDLPPF
jgi:hypothetical protein